MTKAIQSSKLPTNKLAVGATVAAMVTTYAGPLVAEVWPQVMPPALAGPVMTSLATAVVGAFAAVAVGWFVKDQANIPVA